MERQQSQRWKSGLFNAEMANHVRWANVRGKAQERTGVAWGVQDSRIEDYADTFNPVLGNQTLPDLLEETVRRPGRTAILDLMASTTVVQQAIYEYGFNYGMAVSLGFKKRIHRGVGSNEVDSVNTDLTIKKSWNKIRKVMARRGVSSFDIILSRPVAGITDTKLQLPVLFYMLQEAWKLLSVENGIMMFQFPTHRAKEILPYVAGLSEQGLNISWECEPDRFRVHSVVIRKTPESPRLLPSHTMLGMKK